MTQTQTGEKPHSLEQMEEITCNSQRSSNLTSNLKLRHFAIQYHLVVGAVIASIS